MENLNVAGNFKVRDLMELISESYAESNFGKIANALHRSYKALGIVVKRGRGGRVFEEKETKSILDWLEQNYNKV
jgi:hypothetical protein